MDGNDLMNASDAELIRFFADSGHQSKNQAMVQAEMNRRTMVAQIDAAKEQAKSVKVATWSVLLLTAAAAAQAIAAGVQAYIAAYPVR